MKLRNGSALRIDAAESKGTFRSVAGFGSVAAFGSIASRASAATSGSVAGFLSRWEPRRAGPV
jgi:hypothetical protein